MPKRIFVAATMQNDGKTTVSLGLIAALREKFKKISFIKPVGQRYLIEDGYKVDEDSVTIEEICRIRCQCTIKDMSPVAIEKGFTEQYIRSGERESLVKQILQSFERVAAGQELVIIEGTGHAGVGSVFDLSNADVARLLNSKVILVASGGIGRPIDEIMLNKVFFDSHNVELLGVIVNKVMPEKYEKINEVVRLGLGRKGVRVLGVMPFNKVLTTPTIGQILQETEAEFLSAKKGLDNVVEKIIVGAMEPHNALSYLAERSLIITPGDREDIMLTAATAHLMRGQSAVSISGILLTGGMIPNESTMRLLEHTDIPILRINTDTYTAAARIHDMTIKIRPEDTEKAKEVIKMVSKYVDVDTIASNL
jgi:BioD-like phosphotransacetylase family protein